MFTIEPSQLNYESTILPTHWAISLSTNAPGTELTIMCREKKYFVDEVTNQVTRAWGAGALDTMQAVLRGEGGFETANTVIVATIDGYWDALCGAPVCGRGNGVLALVNAD